MKKVLFLLALTGGIAGAVAQDAPLWLRNAAISPDGRTIAFTYRGDIFSVDAAGGRAVQLTTNPAYDTAPVWSPDGSRIAFASDRDGSVDVFVMPASGGTARRLTDMSQSEMPLAWLDSATVLYSAAYRPDRRAAQGDFASQVYAVRADGSARPTMYSTLPMGAMSVNPATGAVLYQDKKGYENTWRKHERSSGTSDIWLLDGG